MGASCLHGLQLRLHKEPEEFLLWILLYVLAEILWTPIVLLTSLRVKLWLSTINVKLLHLSELILIYFRVSAQLCRFCSWAPPHQWLRAQLCAWGLGSMAASSSGLDTECSAVSPVRRRKKRQKFSEWLLPFICRAWSLWELIYEASDSNQHQIIHNVFAVFRTR